MSLEPKEQKKPKNVKSHLWEKFQALEKRTNEVTRKSTEKRIKHLQLNLLDTVNQEFSNDEDKDILRKHDVKFGPPVERLQEKRKRKADKDVMPSKATISDVRGPIEKLQNYMDLNDHLVTTDHSRPPPQTALEKKIDSAICHGDVSTAEALSDQLAERQWRLKGPDLDGHISLQFGEVLARKEEWNKIINKRAENSDMAQAAERIVSALDSKKYIEEKEKLKETAKSKKKRKLPWGFEHKERWEMKGNM